MEQNQHDSPEEPSRIDPELGTERQSRIGGWWRDLFTGRVALAVLVLLWVVFLVFILLRLMYG
jgi:hypothetical protein